MGTAILTPTCKVLATLFQEVSFLCLQLNSTCDLHTQRQDAYILGCKDVPDGFGLHVDMQSSHEGLAQLFCSKCPIRD